MFDCQIRLIDQQMTPDIEAPLQNVGMRRIARTLPKRAFEVTSANASERRQLTQVDPLPERIFNIREHELERSA